jgi:hypothetical protein
MPNLWIKDGPNDLVYRTADGEHLGSVRLKPVGWVSWPIPPKPAGGPFKDQLTAANDLARRMSG